MESLVEELSSSSLKVTRIEYAAEFSSRNGERFAEWEKDLGRSKEKGGFIDEDGCIDNLSGRSR